MAQLCRLPDNPSLEQLKNQARDLQRSVQSGDSEAVALFEALHPRASEALADPPKLKLADAQLATARLYGFPSWPRLSEVVEEIRKWTRLPHRQSVGGPIDSEKARHDEFLRLACLNYGADDLSRPRRAQQMLAEHPEIAGGSLHAACAAGDGQGVRDWLAKRPRLASQAGGPFDWDPLLYLCYSRLDDQAQGSGFSRAATALLDAGADPNAGYLWEGYATPFTALTGAFGEGENRHNQPPHQLGLHLARLLLERGADPNDSQALYNRQWSESDEHLELLLEFGLGQGDGGPWHRRLGEAHSSPKQMIEEELIKAAAAGRSNRVRLMLQAGADPNGFGDRHPVHRGRRAYELAVVNGNPEIAELLAAAGADVPKLSAVEVFASHCLAGEWRAVDELLADRPELLDEAKRQHPELLLRAAQLRRMHVMRRLVALGFDVNHGMDRVTALHQAAWDGDREMAELLIELSADPTIRDDTHHGTPRNWAIHSNNQEVADYLESVGG